MRILRLLGESERNNLGVSLAARVFEFLAREFHVECLFSIQRSSRARASASQRDSRSIFAGSLRSPRPRSRTECMIASMVACGVGRPRSNVVGEVMAQPRPFAIWCGG